MRSSNSVWAQLKQSFNSCAKSTGLNSPECCEPLRLYLTIFVLVHAMTLSLTSGPCCSFLSLFLALTVINDVSAVCVCPYSYCLVAWFNPCCSLTAGPILSPAVCAAVDLLHLLPLSFMLLSWWSSSYFATLEILMYILVLFIARIYSFSASSFSVFVLLVLHVY